MSKDAVRPVYMVYPGLYPLLMFNYWVNRSKIPIVGIMLSGFDTKYQGHILPFYKEFIFFFKRCGWRYSIYLLFIAKFGVSCVRAWNMLRRLAGKKIKIKTFEEIAREKGIPIYYCSDFNGKGSLNFIKNVHANLIVSAYNNQILKPRIINFPSYKTINIHPGRLPDFRGLDAPFEALYNGVAKAGVTIHYVDTGIDTGRIILQECLRIRENDTLFSLNIRLWLHGAKMLNTVIEHIEEDKISASRQRPDKAKYPYRSHPKKERVGTFVKHGGRLIRIKDLANTFK